MNLTILKSKLKLVPATLKDYPTVQNMARFYVYDISRYCGFISDDWACPTDGLYESYDFKSYFEDPTQRAFLIKIGEELAGFVLLNQIGRLPNTQWNMGQFFILAKFQNKGIGNQVTRRVWEIHSGEWEVSVIPENKAALAFWRKTVSTFTAGKYTEQLLNISEDGHQFQRYILNFNTSTI